MTCANMKSQKTWQLYAFMVGLNVFCPAVVRVSERKLKRDGETTLRELRSLPCLSNRTVFLHCYPRLNSSKKKKHFFLCDIRNNSVCQKLGFLLPF